MSEKSLIVVGAGLAGLSTGCYAQMNGYRTRIYEQHTRVGGVCTAWKRKGYTIDGCIHWLMGARPGAPFHRLYCEVGALEGVRLRTIDLLARFLDEQSRQCLSITADLDRLDRDMCALSPEDGPLVDAFVGGIRAFQDFPLEVNKPLELSGRLDALVQAWRMRRWLGHLVRRNTSVAAYAARFQSPFLRWAISNVFVPEMPLAWLFVLLAQLASGELAAVEGGSLAFALAIARRYRALGGKVIYGAPVQEIRVDGAAGRATGVRLADGAEHHADVVISAADGHSTIFDMLGGRYVDDKIVERYGTWPTFRPLLLVSFGVACDLSDHPPETVLHLHPPLSIAGRPVEGLLYRVFQDPTLAPAGKTVVQATIETRFETWAALQDDRPRYEAAKVRLAADVLDRLEAHLPGIAAHVEMVDVATPYTFWRYTRNRRGAYEGWLMSAAHANRPLPKTLPGLRDFYMAGQWVEPGGGVPVALYSGKQVVQILCHRDRKPFHVLEP